MSPAPAPAPLAFSQKFIRGEAQYGFWGVLGKGIGFVNTIITVASLSLYQYGVFQLVLSLYGAATYFTSIGDSVINNDITRFIREKKEGYAKKLFWEYNSLRVIISVILWALFFFGATLFADKYSMGFVNEIRLISLLFLTEVFFNATESLLAARLKFAVVASRPVIAKAAQLIVLIGFLSWGHLGLKELLISMIAGSIISTLAMVPAFLALTREWRAVRFTEDHILISIVKTYGKWDLYRQFFAQMITRVQPWLIKVFVSTEAVAIFSIATAFISAIKDIGFPIKSLKTLVPLYLGNAEKTQTIFIRSLRYLFWLSLLLVLGALLVVPVITHLLLPKYVPSLPYFYAMLPSIPVSALGVITGTFLIAFRRQRFLFWESFMKNAIIISCYTALLPTFGLWALALEETLTPLIALIVVYCYLRRTPVGVQFRWRQLFRFEPGDKEFLSVVYQDTKQLIKRKMHLQ